MNQLPNIITQALKPVIPKYRSTIWPWYREFNTKEELTVYEISYQCRYKMVNKCVNDILNNAAQLGLEDAEERLERRWKAQDDAAWEYKYREDEE